MANIDLNNLKKGNYIEFKYGGKEYVIMLKDTYLDIYQ
jgi:hypothetical protein